jgi:hypothetical protein
MTVFSLFPALTGCKSCFDLCCNLGDRPKRVEVLAIDFGSGFKVCYLFVAFDCCSQLRQSALCFGLFRELFGWLSPFPSTLSLKLEPMCVQEDNFFSCSYVSVVLQDSVDSLDLIYRQMLWIEGLVGLLLLMMACALIYQWALVLLETLQQSSPLKEKIVSCCGLCLFVHEVFAGVWVGCGVLRVGDW